MVDVNGHFDVHYAIDFGHRIASAHVLWYEEPVRLMRHVRAIDTVARAQPVALAAGENEYSLVDFDRLVRSGAIRWLQPEITKVGGLTMARRVGAVAELHTRASTEPGALQSMPADRNRGECPRS